MCGRQVSGNGERGVAVVRLLRRWGVEQRDEPVDSCGWVTVADGGIDDEIPRDAGMSTVEYAVGTVDPESYASLALTSAHSCRDEDPFQHAVIQHPTSPAPWSEFGPETR